MNLNENITIDKSQVRPWIRHWARFIDYIILGISVGIVLTIFSPKLLENINDKLLGYLLLILWIIPESLLLYFFGTTPGKALFKIHIFEKDNQKISLKKAISRSVEVWIRGIGIGFPLATIFTMISSFNKLTSQGTTQWDNNKFIVHHGHIGIFRYIIIFSIITIFFSLYIYNIISELNK